MDDKMARDITIIDFRNYSPFMDYFVIATALNKRNAQAIIDNVEQEIYKNGFQVKKTEKNSDSKWLLLDLGDIVCHVFYDGERELYNLEGLWKDLPTVQL